MGDDAMSKKKAIGQNTEANTGQRGKLAAPWKPGQSGNPGGRPKSAVSLVHWMREFGGMTTEQVADKAGDLGREFRRVKTGDLPLVALAALKAWAAIISEPTPGLFGQFLDRIDGEVGADSEGAKRMTIRVIYEDKTNDDGTDDRPTSAETSPSAG